MERVTERGTHNPAFSSTPRRGGRGRAALLIALAARLGAVPGSRREEARLARGTPVALRLRPEGDLYLAVLPGRILRLGPR